MFILTHVSVNCVLVFKNGSYHMYAISFVDVCIRVDTFILGAKVIHQIEPRFVAVWRV